MYEGFSGICTLKPTDPTYIMQMIECRGALLTYVG